MYYVCNCSCQDGDFARSAITMYSCTYKKQGSFLISTLNEQGNGNKGFYTATIERCVKG